MRHGVLILLPSYGLAALKSDISTFVTTEAAAYQAFDLCSFIDEADHPGR